MGSRPRLVAESLSKLPSTVNSVGGQPHRKPAPVRFNNGTADRSPHAAALRLGGGGLSTPINPYPTLARFQLLRQGSVRLARSISEFSAQPRIQPESWLALRCSRRESVVHC